MFKGFKSNRTLSFERSVFCGDYCRFYLIDVIITAYCACSWSFAFVLRDFFYQRGAFFGFENRSSCTDSAFFVSESLRRDSSVFDDKAHISAFLKSRKKRERHLPLFYFLKIRTNVI